jgi:hypothetical protein
MIRRVVRSQVFRDYVDSYREAISRVRYDAYARAIKFLPDRTSTLSRRRRYTRAVTQCPAQHSLIGGFGKPPRG